MHYIGIDPGAKGGAALLGDNGDYIESIKFQYCTEQEIADTFRQWSKLDGAKFLLEKSQAMKKNGRKQGVASTWKTGDGYGFLRGVLTGARIPFDIVKPLKWQTELNCRTGGDKNVTKAKALRCWPSVKVTHAIADAMLIAVYCKYKN